MLVLDSRAVAKALPYDELINALAVAFAGGIESPDRMQHQIEVPEQNPGTLLLMPAWQSGGACGIKIATVFPDNSLRSLPSVMASYLVLNAKTGMPAAFLDGSELTVRRTAAASALASSYASRQSSSKLLMVGTGSLAPHLIAAHATVRPITEVQVWGRRAEAAEKVAADLSGADFSVGVVENLEQAVGDADIISCATTTTDPLIRGSWLREGQHLDLVGSFTPAMREADSECVSRAEIYVDTRTGTLSEAGEIVQAIEKGIIAETDIKAELRELVTDAISGRQSEATITLFKSVGTALEDLAAAELAIRNHVR